MRYLTLLPFLLLLPLELSARELVDSRFRSRGGLSMFFSDTEINSHITSGFVDDKVRKELLGTALGFNIGATAMINHYFGIEADAAWYNYDNSSGDTINQSVDLIPLSIMAQYYPAPFGDITPYIGIGAHHTFIHSNNTGPDLNNTSGIALQAGFDWWGPAHWGLNINVKYLHLSTDFTEVSDILSAPGGAVTSTSPVKRDVTFDPIILQIGFAARF